MTDEQLEKNFRVASGERAIILLAIFALGFLLIWGTGCAPTVVHKPWTTVAGVQCDTTKVKMDFYSGETATMCNIDGKPTPVATNHSDLSMLYAVGAVMAAIIALL